MESLCLYLFYPAGATRCTDGGEIWHLLRAKFHPYRCNDKGIGPPKPNFLLRVIQNVEYIRPAGVYPLRDFDEICKVCTTFYVRQLLKLGLICSRDYGVRGC